MSNLVKANVGKIEVKKGSKTVMYVGELEQKLLERYPRKDAIKGDLTGLLVGDPLTRVKRVAVALDPTISAIEATKASGANVLLTHHPAHRGPVLGFYPKSISKMTCGSVVYEAISNDIALMNFHTALDVSIDAQRVLPSLLHLEPVSGTRKVGGKKVKARVLLHNEGSKSKGFGQVCRTDTNITLSEFASRCTSVFGRSPRVWGDMHRKVKRVVCALGSATNLIDLCLNMKIDVLVAGEVKYHDALAASEGGLAIIDLGHDVSELPLVAVLANACKKAGISSSQIVILDQSHNWQQTSPVTI